jgi:hypothetical protein
MSIAQLHRSTAHPPCPEDHTVLEVTVPADRSELALADRLSLRIGLWLLLRAQRAPRRAAPPIDVAAHFPGSPRLSQREAAVLLTYGLQSQLR